MEQLKISLNTSFLHLNLSVSGENKPRKNQFTQLLISQTKAKRKLNGNSFIVDDNGNGNQTQDLRYASKCNTLSQWTLSPKEKLLYSQFTFIGTYHVVTIISSYDFQTTAFNSIKSIFSYILCI